MTQSRRRFMQCTAGMAASLAGPAWPAGAAPLAGKAAVLGHRGACAVALEHTLAGYLRAIADGADAIEPDLVCTRDGVLVARHELDLSATTDVAHHPEFASRRVKRSIDGVAFDGWFVDDFTFAELRTLRAVEPLPSVRPANARENGIHAIPRWEEIVALAAAQAQVRGRPVGLVPELKHVTAHAARQLDMVGIFARAVSAHPYTRSCPLIVQAFERSALQGVRQRLGQRAGLELMQLIDDNSSVPADSAASGGTLSFDAMTSPAGLRHVAGYADSIGPAKGRIIEAGPDGRLGAPTALVTQAHQAGLRVHAWTFRPENRFLPPEYRQGGPNSRNEAGALAEMRRYLAAGVDGLFADDPALARRAVDGGERA